MNEAEYKYKKRFQKHISGKRSDGNYGSNDIGGSISIEVGYDHPSELDEILGQLKEAEEFDKTLFNYMGNLLETSIEIPETEMQVLDTKTHPPPRPTGNGISSLPQTEGILKISEYTSVPQYLEEVMFSKKEWPDGGVSYSRKNEAGDYVAFALTRDKSRYGCKIGGEWYKPHQFGDDTDKLVSNVTKVWEKETSN